MIIRKLSISFEKKKIFLGTVDNFFLEAANVSACCLTVSFQACSCVLAWRHSSALQSFKGVQS